MLMNKVFGLWSMVMPHNRQLNDNLIRTTLTSFHRPDKELGSAPLIGRVFSHTPTIQYYSMVKKHPFYGNSVYTGMLSLYRFKLCR